MLEIDNVTCYSVPEILEREDNTLSEGEIISFLKSNPSYYIEKDGEFYSSHTAIRMMNNREDYAKKIYLAGAQGLDMRDVNFKGRILDIGAGGEGIIGQIAGEQSVGIAPEEHTKGLERAPGSGLKIMMDAKEMKFLDNTFDSAAAFYTLMYIENKDHKKVFSEIYRVLKPGGECIVWDMVIPERGQNEKEGYMLGMEIQLKNTKVLTGYGAVWINKTQSTQYFTQIAHEVGFEIVEAIEDKHLIYIKLRK
jgi:SAM-dependent methyltransferase